MSSTDISKNIDLLVSGKGTDLIIETYDENFRVHQSVVMPRSNVDITAVNGDHEAVYQLPYQAPQEPDIVRRMIRFLYTGEYDDTETAALPDDQGSDDKGKGKGKEKLRPRADFEVGLAEEDIPRFDVPSDEEADDTEARMIVHVKVYSLAEHLKIDDLKEYARVHFKTLATDYWPYEDLPGMIDSVYDSTDFWDNGLRSTMIDVCVAHYEELMLAESVLDMMARYGDLAVEVMREVVHILQQDIRGLRASRRSGNGVNDKGKGKMASVKNALKEIEEGEEQVILWERGR